MNIRLAVTISILVSIVYLYIVVRRIKKVVRSVSILDGIIPKNGGQRRFERDDPDTIDVVDDDKYLKFNPAQLGYYTIVFSIISAYLIYGMAYRRDRYMVMSTMAVGVVLLLFVTGAMEYFSDHLYILAILLSLAFMVFPTVGTVSRFLPLNPYIVLVGVIALIATIQYTSGPNLSNSMIYLVVALNVLFVYLAFQQAKRSYRYASPVLPISLVLIPMILFSSTR